MQKLCVVALTICLLFAMTALNVSAAKMQGPVGAVTVYYGTPEIDGVISEEEYTGARQVVINHTNMKALPDVFQNSQVPETLTITSYQLWDETGLYLAFDVHDETPVTGGVTADNIWQLNADNIQIFLDPGPTLAGQVLLDTEQRGGRRSPMYTIGVNEDGTVYYLRQLVKNEMIANLVENGPQAAGQATEYGWCFEMNIPWEMLVTDINEKVEKSELTLESFKEGMDVVAMFIYNDVELRGETRTQIGMYETSYLDESSPFDWQPEVFGIDLVLSSTAQEDAPPYIPPATEPPTEPVVTVPQVTVPDETETTEPDEGTGQTQQSTDDEPQNLTVIFAIVGAAVGACVAAGVVIAKKRKKTVE